MKLSLYLLLSCFLIWKSEAQSNSRLGFLHAFEAKNSLNIGDKCNNTNELERQKLFKSATKTLSPTGFSLDDKSIRNLLNVQGPFCNLSKHLTCASDGVCGCAQTEESRGVPLGFIREGNDCFLTSGSFCQAVGPETGEPILICASSAKCVMLESKKDCTFENIEAAAATKTAERAKQAKNLHQVDVKDTITDILTIGICVCGGNIQVASFLLIFIISITHSLL